MPDGYEVEPATLRGASRDVYAGADAVQAAAAALGGAQLVPAALGAVAAADELARAFAAFAGEHGEDLRHAAGWLGEAAGGLVSSATDYERRDGNAAAGVTAAGS